MISKDKAKVKKHLVRVVSRLRDTMETQHAESPDPLTEYSSSVQEHFQSKPDSSVAQLSSDIQK